MVNAKVVDLSHNNADVSFHDFVSDGILAVFFKATQGAGFKDDTFLSRVARARSVGLRVGAYHFIDGSDHEAQLGNYLEALSGQGPMLQALDFESNPAGADATGGIAEDMIDSVLFKYDRHPVVYGSNYLALLSQGSHAGEAALCPVWEARYSTHQPTPPPPFKDWSIWQYTEDGPIVTGGVERTDIDLSIYNPAIFADDAAFLAWWDAREVSVA